MNALFSFHLTLFLFNFRDWLRKDWKHENLVQTSDEECLLVTLPGNLSCDVIQKTADLHPLSKRRDFMKQFLRNARSWLLRPITNDTQTIINENASLHREIAKLKTQQQKAETLANETLLYAARPTIQSIRTRMEDSQLNFRDTLIAIKKNRLSFSRFGDGEFKLMLRPSYALRFQPYQPNLAKDLRAIFTEENQAENLLVGFPTLYQDLHWSKVWLDIWPEVETMMPPSSYWGNSHVSRPICFETLGEEAVQLWREIWDGRDIVLITGRNSRMTIKPELFDNARSIKTIYGEPINAYEHLDKLRDELSNTQALKCLYLIALGPSGTVLSAELAAKGEQAIDIGHISDSYETVFENAVWPESKPVLQG